jgi:hypothetical protein
MKVVPAMQTHANETALPIDVDAAQTPQELVLGAALYLLSVSAVQGFCPAKARAVIQHLEMLAGHPEVHTHVRKTAAHLIDGWRDLLHELPVPDAVDEPVQLRSIALLH